MVRIRLASLIVAGTLGLVSGCCCCEGCPWFGGRCGCCPECCCEMAVAPTCDGPCLGEVPASPGTFLTPPTGVPSTGMPPLAAPPPAGPQRLTPLPQQAAPIPYVPGNGNGNGIH